MSIITLDGEVIPSLRIDDTIKSFIPPLSEDEQAALTASLKEEGLREPLVVWDNGDRTLIDGHHRLAVCQTFGIPVVVRLMKFDDMADVLVWMLRNQLGRRNLTDFTRIQIALRLKDMLSEKAAQNQLVGLTGKKAESKVGRVNAQIAELAGSSHETVRKVGRIMQDAPEYILNRAARGEISIDRAYTAANTIHNLPDEVKAVGEKYGVEDVDTLKALEGLRDIDRELFNEIEASGFVQADEEENSVPIDAGYKTVMEAVEHRRAVIYKISVMDKLQTLSEQGVVDAEDRLHVYITLADLIANFEPGSADMLALNVPKTAQPSQFYQILDHAYHLLNANGVLVLSFHPGYNPLSILSRVGNVRNAEGLRYGGTVLVSGPEVEGVSHWGIGHILFKARARTLERFVYPVSKQPSHNAFLYAFWRTMAAAFAADGTIINLNATNSNVMVGLASATTKDIHALVNGDRGQELILRGALRTNQLLK